MQRIASFAFLLLLMIPVLTLAEPNPASPTDATTPLVVDAAVRAATNKNADRRLAQEAATRQALDQAVLDFAQQQVDPKVWAAERTRIEWFLRMRGHDSIARYDLHKKRIETGNVVHVWLKVWLKEDGLRNAFLSDLARPATVILHVAAGGQATRDDAEAAQTTIAEALVDSGAALVEEEQLAQARWERQLEAAFQDDVLAERLVSLGFLSDLLISADLKITPSQSNAGIVSALASANVKAVRSRDARVIFSRRFTEHKGFGRDLEQASRKALDELMPALASYVAEQMAAYRASITHTVWVQSTAEMDAATWERIARRIGEAGVPEVKVQPALASPEGQRAVECAVEGPTLILAALCDSLPGLKTMAYDEDSVSVLPRTLGPRP